MNKENKWQVTGRVASNLIVVFAGVAFYMALSNFDALRAQLRKAVLALLPLPRARSVLEVCSHANRVFGGFIIGKIIDSSIIGVLCFVCMTLLRLPFAVLISVIVGVTNIIPFFGPFIGAVPSILILLIVDPIAALKFAVFAVLYALASSFFARRLREKASTKRAIPFPRPTLAEPFFSGFLSNPVDFWRSLWYSNEVKYLRPHP